MKKILFFVSFLYAFSGFSQDKLGKSKSELNSKSSSSSSRMSSSSSSTSSDEDSPFLGLFGEVLAFVPVAIFKYGIIGDYNNEEQLYNRVSLYPFYEEAVGNYTIFDSIGRKQLRFDLKNNFLYSNNDLFGNHLEAKFRPFQYFYLQGDYRQLWEYDTFSGSYNQLALFNFNIGYDRIRWEQFNFGWTLGATYVGNEVNKAGFSYGLNADYFLSKKFSFVASAKWASINQNPVNTFELQSRYHKKNYFLSINFEHLKIASPVYNFIGIGGGIYF